MCNSATTAPPESVRQLKGREGSSRSGPLAWLRWLDAHFEEWLLAAALLAIILIINAEVFNRYIIGWVEIGNITTWTEELARYIFIYMSYLGASYAIKTNSSIRVNLLVGTVPPKVRQALEIAADLCFLVLCAAVVERSIPLLQMQRQFHQISPALAVPMYVPYFAVPLGFTLMSIRLIQSLVSRLRSTSWPSWVGALAITGAMGLPMYFPLPIGEVGLVFLFLVALILISVPIAISLGLATFATIFTTGTIPVDLLPQVAFNGIDNFPIMAIPFFVSAGVFMGAGGLSSRLLAVAEELVGGMYGGLAMVTIVTCMFFAAISGSGPATVAAVGALTIPAMLKQGYDPAFSAATAAAAGAIGVIIPPSNPFVVYGVVTESSIGRLFMAGVIPGVIVGLSLMVPAYFISRRRGWKGSRGSFSMVRLLASIRRGIFALIVPVIILGGIYGGIMTPSEAGAVAALYGLVVGLFLYRELKIDNLKAVLVDAAQTSGVIIILIAMATIFGRLMTMDRVPEAVAQGIFAVTTDKWVILLLVNIFLLFVGCVMETLAAIVILAPILLPVVLKIGIDPIHFGVIMTVNLAIGFITPPVGVNLFVACGISRMPIEKIARAVIPLMLAMLVALALIVVFPQVSLFIPRLMMGR